MARRLLLVIALALVAASTAGAPAEEDSLFTICDLRRNPAFDVPTVASTHADCTLDGDFDVTARYTTAGEALGPGAGSALGSVTFVRALGSLTDLPPSMLRIGVRIDHAAARAWSTFGQSPVPNGQFAATRLTASVAACGECTVAARRSLSLPSTTQGERELRDAVHTIEMPLPAGLTYADLSLEAAAEANGLLTAGRSAAELTGAITSVEIVPVSDPASVCHTETSEQEPLIGHVWAEAECAGPTGAFATTLQNDSLAGRAESRSVIRLMRTATLAHPAQHAVLTVRYTIATASLVPQHYANGLQPAVYEWGWAELEALAKGPAGPVTTAVRLLEGPTYGSQSPRTGVLRLLIHPEDGSALPAGDYPVTLTLSSEARTAGGGIELTVAGRIDSVSIA